MMLSNTAVPGIQVDELDADLDRDRWSLGSTGYPRRGAVIKGGVHRTSKLHRVVMARVLGRELTPNELVDHINGDKLDNRRSNLRMCSHRENLRNQVLRDTGDSGFVGVASVRRSPRYRAFLTLDATHVHIGMFNTPEEAAWMRDQWAITLHGEFARLNFEYM